MLWLLPRSVASPSEFDWTMCEVRQRLIEVGLISD